MFCGAVKRDPAGGPRGRGTGRNANSVDTQHSLEDGTTDDFEALYQIGSSSYSPYEVVREINGKNVKMEIGTGLQFPSF